MWPTPGCAKDLPPQLPGRPGSKHSACRHPGSAGAPAGRSEHDRGGERADAAAVGLGDQRPARPPQVGDAPRARRVGYRPDELAQLINGDGPRHPRHDSAIDGTAPYQADRGQRGLTQIAGYGTARPATGAAADGRSVPPARLAHGQHLRGASPDAGVGGEGLVTDLRDLDPPGSDNEGARRRWAPAESPVRRNVLDPSRPGAGRAVVRGAGTRASEYVTAQMSTRT